MQLRVKATGCQPWGLVEKMSLALKMQRLYPKSVHIFKNDEGVHNALSTLKISQS